MQLYFNVNGSIDFYYYCCCLFLQLFQFVMNGGCKKYVISVAGGVKKIQEGKGEVGLGLVTLIAGYLLFFLNVVINRTDIANKMLPIIEHHKSV